ncbi:MAG: hypothetical protein M3338_02780 [Actinomycetota bacterium]|nr:hypothetical protein [Actinomycetota bacterium]
MTLHDLRHVILDEPEIPDSTRIHDSVGTVLAQTETLDGINADVAVHPRRPQLVLERLADIFGAALLAVSVLADEYLGIVVSDLRIRFIATQDRLESIGLSAILRVLFGDDYPVSRLTATFSK